MLTLIVKKWIVKVMTVACILNGIGTLKNTGRELMCGSHRPQHGVTSVKSFVAIDKTGLADFQ